MKVLLFVVLALAACVSAQVSVVEKDGKWHWEVANDGKVILKSGEFDSKANAVRSGVALLANGGDKERCDASLGVTNVNGAVIGKTKKAVPNRAATEQQQNAELQQDKAQFNANAADKVDCAAVQKVIRKQLEAYVATHSNGEDIAKTGLKIEIEENKEKKQWNFHIKARNGEIVLRSEQYESKKGAKNGIAAVLQNGGVLAHYTKHQSPKDKQWYFNLKSNGNHKIVGAGEGYVSEANVKRGLEGVKDKVRKILKAILDNEATEEQQQQKKDDKKPEQDQNKKAEQQARKKEQQQKAKKNQQNQQQRTQQTPANGQATQQTPTVGQAAQQTPVGQTPVAQQQGQQQRAQGAQLDDNDVTDDDEVTDEDGDDDDEADM